MLLLVFCGSVLWHHSFSFPYSSRIPHRHVCGDESALEQTKQCPGLGPAAPGDQGAYQQKAEREPWARADDEEIGSGRADHQADQPERGQTG